MNGALFALLKIDGEAREYYASLSARVRRALWRRAGIRTMEEMQSCVADELERGGE